MFRIKGAREGGGGGDEEGRLQCGERGGWDVETWWREMGTVESVGEGEGSGEVRGDRRFEG